MTNDEGENGTVEKALRPLQRRGKPAGGGHLQRATEMAFEVLGRQAGEQMLWLGAVPSDSTWRLPVLSDRFQVDLSARKITASAGREVGPQWRILALHYLGIALRPERLAPEVTFADLPTARSYAQVYHRRTSARLCATAGRDAATLRAAAAGLGGRMVDGGDAAFQFDVFPRLSLGLVWHAGDEEFPSSATLLLPANVESYFGSEDVVVLAECLVARLAGRPF
jgi:hypothetical protein